VRPKSGGRRGPRPFVGSRRKRCDLRVPSVNPVKRHITIISRKRKIEVLLWLIDNCVALTGTPKTADIIVTMAVRDGATALTLEQERALEFFRVNGVVYCPPLYKEAAVFWSITKSSTVH